MEKRYSSLRAIGKFCRILGFIFFVIVALGIFWIVASAILYNTSGPHTIMGGQENQAGFWYSLPGVIALILGTLLSGFGLVFMLFAIADGIELMISLEENTRVTASALQLLAKPRQQPTTPVK